MVKSRDSAGMLEGSFNFFKTEYLVYLGKRLIFRDLKKLLLLLVTEFLQLPISAMQGPVRGEDVATHL